MTMNRWQKNFNRAMVYDLYLKPILFAVVTYIVVLLLTKWVFTRNFNAMHAVLAILLYYALYLDAKLDMLKRTLDENARFRDTRKLWIEGELQ